MTEVPPTPKALLVSQGLRPKRHFGQNFLSDAHTAARIAELATTPPDGTVVEIGAGTGALTSPLLKRASRVIAIERDRDLVPVLRQQHAPEIEAGRLIIEEADAKQAPLAQWLASGPRPHVLAGNLPYQITGPLLEQAVALGDVVDRIVFLVQLEVATRLADIPGGPAYGALSVFTQARFEVRREFVVRRGCFYPSPNVDSAVISMTPLATPVASETDTFRAVVHSAFQQRRKMLRNAWKNLLGRTTEEVLHAAQRADIDLNLRGEVLSVEQFAKMAEEIVR